MKHIIVAWNQESAESFESMVPLVFIGKRNLELNFGNNIHVVFLGGLSLLDDTYKATLKTLGYILHDAENIYNQIESQYPALAHFGNNAKKWFLRWLVIKELFAGESFIHYDGDIVLNESLAEIERRVQGMTFVLEGCPAFTVVSNQLWLEQYQCEFQAFMADVEGYSNQAWVERQGWEQSFTTRWAGSRFEKIFLHDQDFLSHLIHTSRIIQQPVEDVLKAFDSYILVENALLFNLYCQFTPYRYTREHGIDYFYHRRPDDPSGKEYKKRILFWHMQSCFNFYLAQWTVRKKMFLPALFRVPYVPHKKTLEVKFNAKINAHFYHATRLNMYRYFFEQHDFSGILSDRAWHVKGTFV